MNVPEVCFRCGYSWDRRKAARPKSCPSCKSYRWQTESKTVRETMRKIDNEAADKALTEAIRSPVSVPETSTNDLEWAFTRDAPQFAEDGNVYRKQALLPDRKKFRTVRVDDTDHDLIK